MNALQNRTKTAKALTKEIVAKGWSGYTVPVILTLPRGGVPVGVELACKLKALMDLLMIRQIGIPGQPELAAVLNGKDPQIVTDKGITVRTGLSSEDIDTPCAKNQLQDIQRRKQACLKGHAEIPVEGGTAIVVVDRIASGAMVRASLRVLQSGQSRS